MRETWPFYYLNHFFLSKNNLPRYRPNIPSLGSCHHSMARPLGSRMGEKPMAPWTSGAAYGQGENFSSYPTTDVKLGTSDLWIGN